MKGVVLSVLLLVLVSFFPAFGQTAQLTLTAVNRLKIARQSETIEVSAEKLAPLGEKDLMKIHVRDGSGKEVLAQSVDTDYDDYRKPDTLIFQADFGPQ